MDKAVQNQKVFVTLGNVLELQKEIERLQGQTDLSTSQAQYIRGLKRAAELLELPLRLTK